MIVGSLLLILTAVGLLGLGLVRGSNAFLIGSIVASLLAAILLIVGARRAASARAAANGRLAGGFDRSDLVDTMAGQAEARDPRGGSDAREALRQASRGSRPGGAPGEREAAMGDASGADTIVEDVPTQVFIPPQSRMGMSPDSDLDEADGEEFGDEDPPDEPAAQVLSPQDAARVARMSTEVLVIDGRPRYHHPACVHLLGRENEPLPVSEAVELGFTPCGLCEPDSVMLAEAHRA